MQFLKIFFSRTTWPNAMQLCTNCPWVKQIQVCSNKGPGLLKSGDNHTNIKYGVGLFFSGTNGPILTRLDTNHV
jgi:hypothetical protein